MINRRPKLGKVTISKLRAWLRALFLAVLVCWLPVQITLADTSAEWRHLAVPATQAQKKGDVNTALKLWTKALVLAQKMGSIHPWYSITLRNLISLHFYRNDDLNLIVKLINQDLDAIRPLGPSYLDKTLDLQYLGRIDSIKGQFAESRKCYEEAFALGDRSQITKETMAQLLALEQVPYLALHAEKEATEARDKLIRLLIHRHPGRLADAIGETLMFCGDIEHDCNIASLANRPYFYDAEINLLTPAIELGVQGTEAKLYRIAALTRRSECYFQKANFLAAAVDQRSAADILRNDTSKDMIGRRIDHLNNAAAYFSFVGDDSEALPLIEESIRVREKLGCKTADDSRALRRYKQTLANCYINLHKPEQTLVIYNAMLKEPLDQQTRDTILSIIVNLYDTMGDRKSFLEYLNLSAKHTDTMKDTSDVIVRWAWLSDRYALVGCGAQADQCMAKSLRIANRLYATKPDDLARVRVTLSELWLDRLRLDEAANCAREALAACKTKKLLNDWQLRGRALNVLAQADTVQHHFDEAIKAWRAELDLAKTEPNNHPVEVVNIPGSLAQLYAFQGDYARANEFANQAREMGVTYGTGYQKDLRELGLLDWAQIASKEGRFDQSDQACRKIIQGQTNREYRFLARYVLVRNLIEQRKLDQAAKEAQEAIDLQAIRLDPYFHSIGLNSLRMWAQLFTGLRARAIDLSGDHVRAQPIFEQLATDDHDIPASFLPLFANCWCWRADNLRALALTKQADDAAKMAHKFYEAPGWNLFDERAQCDSAKPAH